jgi:hypothetical protein
VAALDVETVDGTNNVTEIGIYTWHAGVGKMQHWHYLITDNEHLPRRFSPRASSVFRYGRTIVEVGGVRDNALLL